MIRKSVLALALAASAGIVSYSFTASQAPVLADHHEHDKKKDIIDTAVGAGQFKTLAAALTAAGLVDTLKSEGPFTVFAPTDEAFKKLPAGTVESLLKPENKEKLKSILTYHVVASKATSKEVVKMDSAKTVQGDSVAIKVKDGKVMIDGATVTKADVMASNGVIHVIDTVLTPEAPAAASR
jgi:uncharacterized surface protein with fasciclin (FAS1) repeats